MMKIVILTVCAVLVHVVSSKTLSAEEQEFLESVWAQKVGCESVFGGIITDVKCMQGTCSSTTLLGNTYEACTCEAGWEGKYCNTRNSGATQCIYTTCTSGSTCTSYEAQFCTCTDGTTAQTSCTKDSLETVSSIPYFDLLEDSSFDTDITAACFHGSTAVSVPGGGERVMSSLREGDEVMVITEEGDVRVDRVVLMAHSNSRQVANFTVVSVGDRELKLSKEHYVLVGSPSATVRHVRADQVKVSDLVVTSSGDLQPVRSVQHTVERGVYSPVTQSGHLLTEDVLTSVYAADVPLLTDPRLMHVLMWPLRVAGRAPLSQWWDNKEGRPLLISALNNVLLSTVKSF